MEELLSGMDRKRRGFLTMKGAEPQVTDAAFFQIDNLAYDLYNISTFLNPGYNIFS